MKYISASEVAKKRGIRKEKYKKLCKENRIPGILKLEYR